MKIEPMKPIGANRPLCEQKIRVAAGLVTKEAQRGAHRREMRNIPVNQCGRRSDFTVDGTPLCRAHAGQVALAHLLEPPPRTDADEIARPRCGCSSETVRRVIVEHGTCTMGGCPYGGDL